VVVGASGFLQGLTALLLASSAGGTDAERLFELNVFIGLAVIGMGLGGVLVFQAASALGGVGSGAMPMASRWYLLAPLPVFLVVGQLLVNEPDRMPWLFPFVNAALVTIPSVVIASVAATRYAAFARWAWPVSWREWMTAILYGALGATSVAAVLNVAYLTSAAAVLTAIHDAPGGIDGLTEIPRAWRVAYDLSVFSFFGPFNEEFWKGLIVAFFFFRRGGAGRCFLWGALTGAGFNLYETFANSLAIANPDALAEQTITNQWWMFAVMRSGTGVMHAAATGLAAVGFYGLFRGRRRFVPLFLAGWALHGSWNFTVYVVVGDAFPAESGADSGLLDALGWLSALVLVAASSLLLWELPRRIRDERPAAIYDLLGMIPGDDARHRTAGSATVG